MRNDSTQTKPPTCLPGPHVMQTRRKGSPDLPSAVGFLPCIPAHTRTAACLLRLVSAWQGWGKHHCLLQHTMPCSWQGFDSICRSTNIAVQPASSRSNTETKSWFLLAELMFCSTHCLCFVQSNALKRSPSFNPNASHNFPLTGYRQRRVVTFVYSKPRTRNCRAECF